MPSLNPIDITQRLNQLLQPAGGTGRDAREGSPFETLLQTPPVARTAPPAPANPAPAAEPRPAAEPEREPERAAETQKPAAAVEADASAAAAKAAAAEEESDRDAEESNDEAATEVAAALAATTPVPIAAAEEVKAEVAPPSGEEAAEVPVPAAVDAEITAPIAAELPQVETGEEPEAADPPVASDLHATEQAARPVAAKGELSEQAPVDQVTAAGKTDASDVVPLARSDADSHADEESEPEAETKEPIASDAVEAVELVTPAEGLALPAEKTAALTPELGAAKGNETTPPTAQAAVARPDAAGLASAPTQFSTSSLAGQRNSEREVRSHSGQVDASRFVHRVAKAFEAAQDRGGEVRLRLNPPELGSLKLDIRLQEGVLVARLETETSSARTVLVENLPALRERLAEQGVRIERFDVDLMQQPSGGPAGQPQDRSPPEQVRLTRAPRPLPASPPPAVAPTVVAATGTAAGRLNIII